MMGKDEAIKKVYLASNTEDVIKSVDDFQASSPAMPKIKSQALGTLRTYRPKPPKAKLEQYYKDKQIREEMLKRKMPFISPEVSGDFYFSQGLVLIGGISGRGKSTAASNIVAGFLASDLENKVTFITNEETTEAVYNRIACVQLELSYNDYHHKLLGPKKRMEVEQTALLLTERVTVVDDDAFDMTCLEDVQSVLNYSAEQNVGMVLIDYHQTIAFSRDYPHMESYQVSKKFGLYLKDFGRKVPFPVIDFVQLRTVGEDSNLEFKDRIENDKTLYNHAYQVLEIDPDFENKSTKFHVRKDRFGYEQGRVIETKFNGGRYLPMEDSL